MVDGFTPVCRKIKLEIGKTVEERFRLDVDPAVLREVGDTFFEDPK